MDKDDLLVQDLAMTVRRLCRKINIYTEGMTDTGADIMRLEATQSLDFLKRKGLAGSPLRAEAADALSRPNIGADIELLDEVARLRRNLAEARKALDWALRNIRLQGTQEFAARYNTARQLLDLPTIDAAIDTAMRKKP